jgi:2-iminoacetate synthase ThiH
MQAVERAGLSDLAERALSGGGLEARDVATLRASDVLLVAGLADAVRARHRGDEVRLLASDQARLQPELVRLQLDPGRADGPTGQELLFEIAIARLATPAARGIAVSVEQLGLQLAQTALAFGADTLIADLSSKRTLPLLDGPAARREEIAGLLQRAGRRVRFVPDEAHDTEHAPDANPTSDSLSLQGAP